MTSLQSMKKNDWFNKAVITIECKDGSIVEFIAYSETLIDELNGFYNALNLSERYIRLGDFFSNMHSESAEMYEYLIISTELILKVRVSTYCPII